MKNFLYCFDFNYNIQGFCSIYSLLENTNQPVKIHIIHKDPDLFIHLKSELEKHPKLFSINIYKFKDTNYNFPNIENKHVSEATYYRLFISNYLQADIEHIFYIDADAFFINSIDKDLESNFSDFKNSKYGIAALTTNDVLDNPAIRELGLQNESYFNAGILFIDYQRWLSEDYFIKFLDILQNREIQFSSWDQDILNIFFDGNYFELSDGLNYNINSIDSSRENDLQAIQKNVTVVHYIGSPKPWNIKGLVYPGQKFFYELFRKLFKDKYFLSINNRKNFLLSFKKILLKREHIYVQNKYSFIKEVIISLVLKKEKNINNKLKKLKL